MTRLERHTIRILAACAVAIVIAAAIAWHAETLPYLIGAR